MTRRRFPVAFRLTRHNRNSVAALLAVLERELLSSEKAIEPVLLTSPDAYAGDGLLVYSFTSLARERVAAEMVRLRDRLGPGLRALAGGCHVSAAPEDALRLGFRWAIAGEAGARFASLVRALATDEEGPSPGVLPSETAAAELDRYDPWPASGQLFASIELTRGCPMGCAFCQTPRLFGRLPRHRSLAALERIFAHSCATGHRYTRFVAPNAFGYGSEDGIRPDLPALEGLLAAARRAGMERVYLGTFPSEVRPESVRDDVLALVRERCDNETIAIGLQSGSEALLRALRRGHTVEEGIAAVERIARAGFEPRVDFILGLPGETDVDRAQTCAVIRRLVETCGAVIHAHRFTPLPGTPLADAAPTPLDDATLDLLDQLTGIGRLTESQDVRGMSAQKLRS